MQFCKFAAALCLLLVLPIASSADIPEHMDVVIPDGPHPKIFLTQQEAEAVRSRPSAYEWAHEISESIISQANKLVAEKLEIPHKEGGWTHWYSCEDCGAQLKSESPTEHVCPTCKRVYSGEPYDAVYVTFRHNHYLQGVKLLGEAYILTGDEKYAGRAREILLEYASFYNELELHDVWGGLGTSKAKLFAQTLNSAVSMCHYSVGYDYIYDAECFTEEDHRIIEENFILPMVRVIQNNLRGLSNWQTWHNAGVASAGFVTGREDLVDWAVNGKNGFLYQLREGSLMESGLFYEESPAYHWYALFAMIFQLEAMKRAGMNLYDEPLIEGLFAAPVRQLLPDMTFAPMQDSSRYSIGEQREYYEVAYREYKKPLYAAFAHPRDTPWALFWGADEMPDPALPTMESSNSEGEGLAVLRDSENENVVLLEYGPGRSGHVHLAKLGMILYADGDIRFVDPGRLRYGNPVHKQWYYQTISHNTIAINERSQRLGAGQLEAFASTDEFTVVRASSDKAYLNATLDRTILQKDDIIVDVFTATADEPSTFDLALHMRGELLDFPNGETLDALGKKNGYQHLKQIQVLSNPLDSFELKTSDEGRIHITVFDDSSWYRAEGYGTNSMTELLPMLIRRQQGSSATYAAVYQVLKDGEDPSPVHAQLTADKTHITIPGLELIVDEETKVLTTIEISKTYSIGKDGIEE